MTLNVAEDYNRPHRGHLDHRALPHQINSCVHLHRCYTAAWAAAFDDLLDPASPLPLSLYTPQQDGGGVAGEDLPHRSYRRWYGGRSVAGFIGSMGDIRPARSRKRSRITISTYAGKLTPAGNLLTATNLFTGQELIALGVYAPLIQAPPGHYAEATWLKTIDLRSNWPLHVGERAVIEP